MRGMDSGSHYTGIIFLKKQVEYDGKIVPWNMRHILQKCFIGSRVYKAAGGPGFHGAVIGKPGPDEWWAKPHWSGTVPKAPE